MRQDIMKQANSTQIISGDQSVGRRNSVSCADCKLKGGCFPIAAEVPTVSAFDAIVQRAQPFQKGDYIYRQGQPFTTVYAVRSGAVKAQSISANGEEQITGFYMPGEIFGMDGLGRNRYPTSVIALDTSAVCAIPFDRLRELSISIPTLQGQVLQLMSQAIVADQEMITLLSKYTAERRIAVLLQRVSQHQASRKMSPTKLRLPLSRIDISCYLGLTVETVSRIFGRFQKIGLLMLDNREVDILSTKWLQELADGCVTSQESAKSAARFQDDVSSAAAPGMTSRRPGEPPAVGRAA
jgi:CRP/FNR family transcriptional regulator